MLRSGQQGIDAVERLQLARGEVQCDACFGKGWIAGSTNDCWKCKGSGRIPIGRVELDARSGARTLWLAGLLFLGIAAVIVIVWIWASVIYIGQGPKLPSTN